MTGTLSDYKRKLAKLQSRQEVLQEQIAAGEQNLEKLEKYGKAVEEANVLLQEVAKKTQEELEVHISRIVSLALDSVFSDPYKFQIDFVSKRNRTEADIFFTRDGNRIDPMTASGCGAVDVASFALRVSLWNLAGKHRAVIFLDEPFRFLSKNLQPAAGEVLKQLSEKLNLQFILVSHEEELIYAADKVFHVSQRKGISMVKEK